MTKKTTRQKSSKRNLQNELANTIALALRRRSIDTCSKWAPEYRLMGPPFPGKWSFAHHPWLRDMHDCKAQRVIGQKAAQMGYTETALNKAFFTIDVEQSNVLYVLPAAIPDAKDFSASRFNPALEASDHLRSMFTDTSSVMHKRSKNANLYVRGARSRSQLKSVPIKLLICDELDEMPEQNVVLAMERTSGQLNWQHFFISTPTALGFGINGYFQNSTQNHWFFPCPSCGRQTELIFPECLVITGEDPNDPAILNSHLICKECKAVLPHNQKTVFLNRGNWVPGHAGRLNEGFYINQLYSMTSTPGDLATKYLRAQVNPFDEQEFFNSKLGLPHEVEGARVSEEDLIAITGSYSQREATPDLTKELSGEFVTMGADIGKWNHYEIARWKIEAKTSPGNIADLNMLARAEVLRIGKCQHFEELAQLMYDYKVNYAVIDHQPETRKATEFANKFYGHTALCHYSSGDATRNIAIIPEEHRINVNRTCWMDLSLGRVKNHRMTIPRDTPREYKDHLTVLQRVYEKDKFDNPVGRYVKPDSQSDHYAHARTYNEIAFYLGSAKVANKNIEEVII